MWADCILQSPLADQLLDAGLTARSEVRVISAAFRSWIGSEDDCFSLLYGEVRSPATGGMGHEGASTTPHLVPATSAFAACAPAAGSLTGPCH
jgi:hypothetical protein